MSGRRQPFWSRAATSSTIQAALSMKEVWSLHRQGQGMGQGQQALSLTAAHALCWICLHSGLGMWTSEASPPQR